MSEVLASPEIGKTYSLTAPNGYKEDRTVTAIKNGRVYFYTNTAREQSLGVNEFMRIVNEFSDEGGKTMKATGIVRRIDDLGRVVIPKEIRKTRGIKTGDPIEIFVQDDTIVLKKYQERDVCVACDNSADEWIELHGRPICTDCANLVFTKFHVVDSDAKS